MNAKYFIIILSALLLNKMVAQETSIVHVSNHNLNHFGWEIAADNGFCAIADPRDSVNAYANGSVKLYAKVGNVWSFHSSMQNQNLQAYDYFGREMEMHGNFLAVSSLSNPDYGFMSGAVHIYYFEDNVWKYIQTLTQDIAQEKTLFGESIFMDDNTLYIGAPGTDNEGAVFVYSLVDNKFQLSQKISNPYPLKMQFGKSIAAVGNYLFIGAPSGNMANYEGTVFIYHKSGNQWVQNSSQFEIIPDETDYGSLFGFSVCAEDSALVVGAPHANIASGDGEVYVFGGKVYYYKLVSEQWVKQKVFSNPEPDSHDLFGSIVKLKNNAVYVSSPKDDIEVQDEGSLFQFKFVDGVWENLRLRNSNFSVNSYFSKAFEISSNSLLVGNGGVKTEKNIGVVHCFDLQNISALKNDISIEPRSITIYPNPANDKIFINMDRIKAYNIKIAGLNGQIYIDENGIGTKTLKTNKLSDGTYMLIITDGKETYSNELIIKH